MNDSLLLLHSWPLHDAPARMGLDPFAAPAELESATSDPDALAASNIGVWACDLATERLRWSPAVYALFGLPEDEPITRSFAVSCYAPPARTAMERLRAYAIEQRCGFTMDAMIRRADRETRWMRLSAIPVIRNGKVVRLRGTKLDVTLEYDGPSWRGF